MVKAFTPINPKYPHLLQEGLDLVEKDDMTRIAYMSRESFIPYTRAEKILEDLERLYRREDAVRAQGRLFIGPSLAGKSSILNKFLMNHRADDNVDGDAAIVPVLMVQYPEIGREGIYASICHALNHRTPVSASQARMRHECMELLQAVGVRMLLIDEFHNVLRGNTEEQRIGLTTIKYVMNALGRPVVVAGTSEAFNAVNKDPQMLSRLQPIYLDRFNSTDEDFFQLLAGFEMIYPLRKPSNILEGELSSEIFRLTDGLVGHVADLMSELGRLAIETGQERISLKLLHDSNWVPMTEKSLATTVV